MDQVRGLPPLVSQLRDLLARRQGRLSVVEAARALGRSVRSLQRELGEAGYSYRQEQQAVQLRLRFSFQNLVSGKKLVAYDATGSNPVVLATFNHNVTGFDAGDTILAATPELAAAAGITPDFTLTQRIPDSYVRSTVTMRIEERLRSLSQEIFSRTRLETVIADFDLYPELRATRPMETVVEYMRTKIQVDTVRDDAFKISYTAGAPRTAMIVTDRLSKMFIDENMHDRSAGAENINQFLESQLDDSRQQLIAHEKKLEEVYIFPAVRKTPGGAASYIDVLLGQHERGRDITNYILSISQADRIASNSVEPLAKALESFVRMYEHHAAIEDTVIFPAWKAVTGEAQLDDLGEKFEEI